MACILSGGATNCEPGTRCLLGIDPEKAEKCKPSECQGCGWDKETDVRITRTLKYDGLKRDKKGIYRLKMKRATLRGEY